MYVLCLTECLKGLINYQDFEKEMSIWRMLDHPNIVPVYGVVYVEATMYIVRIILQFQIHSHDL